MTELPTIAYWCGKSVSDMPREELEREFVAAHRRIAHLEHEICDRSIAHVRDLAALRRETMNNERSLAARFMDGLFATH